MAEHFGIDNILRVTHKQQLAKLNEFSYKALIFDDCNLHDFSTEEKIHLLDVSHDCLQRILYSSVTLPHTMTRVIISNKSFKDLMGPIHPSQLDALLRRVLQVDLGSKKLTITVKFEFEFEIEEKDSLTDNNSLVLSSNDSPLPSLKKKRGRPKKS